MTVFRSTIGPVLAAGLLAAVAAGAQKTHQPTGFLFQSIRAAGREYRYTLYVPRDYSSSRAWPLIVFLHGAGECGTDGQKSAAVGIGPAVMLSPESYPFVILIPQKPDVRDAWEDHDEAVMAMVRSVQASHKIDRDRLYLTGLSQGGHGTWAIGAKHPDVWAAIAPVCGYGDPAVFAQPLSRMPIWCFHGDADSVVPLAQSQKIVEAITAAGGTPKLTSYPGVGHNSWDKAYRDEKLGEWLLSNKRTAR